MDSTEKVDHVLEKYGPAIFSDLVEHLWCEKCNRSCVEIRIPSNKKTLPLPVKQFINCECGELLKKVEEKIAEFLNQQQSI